MLRYVVENMGAVQYASMALVLFFGVFMSVLIREWMRPKVEVAHMSDLPLAEDVVVGKRFPKGECGEHSDERSPCSGQCDACKMFRCVDGGAE